MWALDYRTVAAYIISALSQFGVMLDHKKGGKGESQKKVAFRGRKPKSFYHLEKSVKN